MPKVCLTSKPILVSILESVDVDMGCVHSRRPKANTEERSDTCPKFSPPARAAVQKKEVLEVRKHKNMIAKAL